jgi:hypothetical protein
MHRNYLILPALVILGGCLYILLDNPAGLKTTAKASPAGAPNSDPHAQRSPAGSKESDLDAAISETEKQQIFSRVTACRDLLNSMERAHTEILVKAEKVAVVRVEPFTLEELDRVYAALTKAADAFPPGSPAKTRFSAEAAGLIHQYSLYNYGNNPEAKVICLNASNSSNPLPTVSNFSSDAVVETAEDGKISIKARQATSGPDRNGRYSHLMNLL